MDFINQFQKMDFTLTANLPPETLIVDIGMGEGDFVKHCLDIGASVVYGFEERDDLFITAENKLADYGKRVKIYKQRICRSDLFDNQDATRFDFIVSHLPRIDMLKISVGKDVYPILLTSKHLDKIGSIMGTTCEPTRHSILPTTSSEERVGQLHHPKMRDLKKYLEINGFNVDVVKEKKMFFAWKNGGIPFFK